MSGRTVLVTGGTGGIGRATAAGLARLGARVAISGRDPARTAAIAAGIAAETGNPAVAGFAADLSSQAGVRDLAATVLASYPRLEVLVNNVGGYWAHRHVTADGLERTFALNHLAPFLLTHLLLDRLTASAPARVVTVSSGAQAMGHLDFDDLQGERGYYGQAAYNASKLTNVIFAFELARRLEGTGVTSTVLHPGVVRTSLGAEDQTRLFAVLSHLVRPFLKTPARGAETSIYLASSPDVDGVSGEYFANRRPKRANKLAYDPSTVARLWQASADLTGITDRPGSPGNSDSPGNPGNSDEESR
jgi:NAD(P)-dependent dehydrogenase (short-subunit alcohol dehydrogenase family)